MAAKKDEEKKLKQVLGAFLKVKPLPKKSQTRKRIEKSASSRSQSAK